jgi:glucose/arabinose dehydrogenase
MSGETMNRYLRQMLVAALLLGCSACGGGGGDGATAEADREVTVGLTAIASGLTEVTGIVAAGDGSERLFLVEQGGRVRILAGDTLLPAAFLDISDRVLTGAERGLLGLAFPPSFPVSGQFYVNYTRSADGATVVSRFALSAAPDLADPGSENVLLVVEQPFANHNGGQLAFGPDGYLYIGLGDGGSAGDPLDHAQDPGSLLGKLLRIDVDGAPFPYLIPADNPFVGTAGREEIWALGLRNPWRFSFDRVTDDLYIADVGQASWEEINYQPADSAGGHNYEWNRLEGPECFNPTTGCTPPVAAVPPVAFYDHDAGCSVTGGYVYRGPDNPDLQGLYLYGDFCSGTIWGLRRSGITWDNRQLAASGLSISAFGEDEQGRLYVADYATGRIYRIDQQ